MAAIRSTISVRPRVPYAMFSRTRRCGKRAYSWNKKPTGRRCGGRVVQSLSLKMIFPAVSFSRPEMHLRTVVLPEPDGPKSIVIEALSGIRRLASTLAPPLNFFSMSAVSSKEPYLSVECVDCAQDEERYDEKHRRRHSCGRIVQTLDLVVYING